MHYTVGQGGQMSCSGVEGVPEGSGHLQRPWRAEGVRFPKGRGLMEDNSLPLTLNVSALSGVSPLRLAPPPLQPLGGPLSRALRRWWGLPPHRITCCQGSACRALACETPLCAD